MRKAFLEQAARLKLAVPANASVPAILAKSPGREQNIAPRPRPDVYSQKSLWPKTIVALLLLSLTWTLYRRNQERRLVSQIKEIVAAVHQTASPGLNHQRARNVASPQNTGGDQNGPKAGEVANADGLSGNAPAHGTLANPEATAPSSTADPSGTDAAQAFPLTPLPVKMQPVLRQKPSAEDSGSAVVQPNKSDQDGSASASNESEPSVDDSKAPTSVASSEKPSAGTAAEAGASKPDRALTMDGFTRRDVPDLLRQAEVAAQRGDYRLARYEYNLVLRLEPRNARARQGLHLLPATDQPH